MERSMIFGLFALQLSALIKFGYGDLYPYEPRNPLEGSPPSVGPTSVWPKVLYSHSSETHYSVDTSNIEFVVLDSAKGLHLECDSLNWTIGHYKQLIRDLKSSNNGSTDIGISVVRIELAQCRPGIQYPEYGSDELYRIEVKKDDLGQATIALIANNQWGAIRALETFYQLLWPANDSYLVYNVNATEIIDQPRYNHRGIMIDTARHFLPADTIVEILTAMMYNKFNVLHWHIVDDQSFPYVSKKFPELSEKGAYHRNAIYTPETVDRIIEAARVRGVRVILEFDTPGHTGGFGFSHPELLTTCDPESTTEPVAKAENFDPTNEATYEFMREFFSEIVLNVSKDSWVHLGMDEVHLPCWESSEAVRDFMTANGYVNLSQVEGHYVNRHVGMVKGLGANPIAWQDPLDNGVELDHNVTIQIWKEPWVSPLEATLRKGHRVILSACWYINYISYGETWRKYYLCDPELGADVGGFEDQILGGEAAIWGEFVDQANVVATLFPYASAVGEVLWTLPDSSNPIREPEVAKWRLDRYRCSLLRRGVRAQPILNGYCGPFEVDLDM